MSLARAARPAAGIQGTGDARGFFARGGPRGVLVLHGFSGTPFEVRPIADALAAAGFTVSAPLLAGHGATAQDLGRTRWPDWLASAERALDELAADLASGIADPPGPPAVTARGGSCGPALGVAGFSLGGLLALRLARLRPGQVAALACMSTALRLGTAATAALGALSLLPAALRRGPLAVLGKRGYDVGDQAMRRANPGLPALPLAGVMSLVDLAAVVRRDLPSIRVPALVAHGEKDGTIPPAASLELAGTLASDTVERLWLPRSRHLVGIDVERADLARAVVRFFDTHLGAGAHAAAHERAPAAAAPPEAA